MNVVVTKQHAEGMRMCTACQTLSNTWFVERAKRITASISHTISHCRSTSSVHNMIRLVTARKHFYTEATKYGNEHEKDGVEAYQKRYVFG